MENPLLIDQELPSFSNLKNEHIEPAIRQIIEENEQALKQLLSAEEDDIQRGNLIQNLDNLEDRISNAWSTISHLFSVNNSPELREIYDRCQPLITEYFTNLSQNKTLYSRIKSLDLKSNELGLSESQRSVIEGYLLDFTLAGVDLEPSQQLRFKEVEKRLSQLSMKFSNNVLDSTHAWSKHIQDKKQLSGIPEQPLATAEAAAIQRKLDGYVLTLDFPCYHAVVTYADEEELRREIYTAYVTRASDQNAGDEKWKNEEIVYETLKLRKEKADILGYQSYADLSLAKKMADNPSKVIAFLNDLSSKGKPVAEQEFKQLKEYAASLGKQELNAWDVPYYSEKLQKELFDISQEELRPYFPIAKVKQGLFEIVEKLYGIQVVQNNKHDTWHPSVEAYDVFSGGELIARFYLDLYTRDSKRGGAWMGECRSRRELDSGNIQLPAAYLVCNFSKGTGNVPSLLTHNEVTTLFHEFGHGLHHILTVESNLRVSGINGVAWDAVELPSQLMENWCWDKKSINLISSHYETGEALPDSLLEKMLAARNFQAGMKMMRQLEFALFDFELHRGLDNLGTDYVRETLSRTREKTAVFTTPEFNRFENSFSHIFAGGYAAGYYSYYWAEVLSADVFSRFKKAGIFDVETGREFLKKILSRGGSVKALKLFKEFMGREPETKALLQQKGMPAN
jgi:oligopeptidase A